MTADRTGDFSWDPQTYRRYASERDRPFFDLTNRIGATAPAEVVDLGCGDARLTQTLGLRWPSAHVTGLDSSASMIADARAAGRDADGALDLVEGDVRTWAGSEIDVIVSNALLQWVPDHLSLLDGWVDALRPDGWIAFAVPGNAASPSHTVMRELAADERFAGHLAGVRLLEPGPDPADYAHHLLGLGCEVDTWETTYVHVLEGADPVVGWVSGTGLRPVLHALPDDLRTEYLADYAAQMRSAYPTVSTARGELTLLPFRRLFVVAHKVNGATA